MKKSGNEAKSGKTIEFVDIDTPCRMDRCLLDEGAWSGYRALVGIVTAQRCAADRKRLAGTWLRLGDGLVYLPTSKFPPIIGEPLAPPWAKALLKYLDVIDDFSLVA